MSHFSKVIIIFSFLILPLQAKAKGNLDTYPVYDLSLITSGFFVWGIGECLKEDIGPETCRWCSVNPIDEDVRNSLVWSKNNRDLASTISDVFLGTVGVSSLFLAQYRSEELEDGMAGGVVVLESLAISSLLNQIVKFSVARQRPYVRTLLDPHSVSRDRNLSFYSGHTSSAFAMAVSGAYAYYLEGGTYPYFVGSFLLGSALFVGYLRIGADKHYFTDVFTGALVGSFIGWLVTKMHIDNENSFNKNMLPYVYGVSNDEYVFGVIFKF